MSQPPAPFVPAPASPITPRVATSAMFFANGLILATWVLRIPNVRDDLHLSDAQVGTAILGMAVGSMFSMPLSGRWILQLGSAAMTRLFTLLFCLSLPLPFLATGLPTLFLALAVVGLTNGAMDVSMNAQGVTVERRMDRPVLSSFHAWFSLGNLTGALLGSVILGLGAGLWVHVLGTVVFTLALTTAAGFTLLPRRFDLRSESAPPGSGPKGWQRLRLSPLVLGMGLLCFLGMLGEGATGDWSGLYFRDVLHVSGGLVGLGYSTFTLAMTVGRVFGDRWRSRFGAGPLVVAGSTVAGLGVLLALLSREPWPAGFGYALTGLGVANVVPVLYGVAGRAMNGQGIAQVATLGYLGFLAGPPLIGEVAHLLGLRAGLLVIALSLLLVAGLGVSMFGRLRPGEQGEARVPEAA